MNCAICSEYMNYQKQNNSIIYHPFNYKCPCGGEFVTPVTFQTGEFKLEEIREIGEAAIVSSKFVPILKYKCPFCDKVMGGL